MHNSSTKKTIATIRKSYQDVIQSLALEIRKIDPSNKTLELEDHVKRTIDYYYDYRNLKAFVPYIDTINCDNNEKSKIYKLAYQRVKNREPKNNPYEGNT